jgi:hypothetical protein
MAIKTQNNKWTTLSNLIPIVKSSGDEINRKFKYNSTRLSLEQTKNGKRASLLILKPSPDRQIERRRDSKTVQVQRLSTDARADKNGKRANLPILKPSPDRQIERRRDSKAVQVSLLSTTPRADKNIKSSNPPI